MSLVTLRPNHTIRKIEAATASKPRPPARMASRISRLASELLIEPSLAPLSSSAFAMPAR